MDDADLRSSLKALHPASFSWAMVCCRGNRELAEEVLQSAYVQTLDGGARGFDGRSAFRTWLFAVIRNVARQQYRANWWSGVVRLEFRSLARLARAGDAAQTRTRSFDEIARVRAAVDRLAGRQREVAHLVFYEGLTIAEAAEVMNVSLGAARQHYARAKSRLRTLLGPITAAESKTNEPTLR